MRPRKTLENPLIGLNISLASLADQGSQNLRPLTFRSRHEVNVPRYLGDGGGLAYRRIPRWGCGCLRASCFHQDLAWVHFISRSQQNYCQSHLAPQKLANETANRPADHRADLARAGMSWLAVDEHHAAPALFEATAVARALEAKLIAQHLQQRCSLRRADRSTLTIHGEFNGPGGYRVRDSSLFYR